MALNAYLTFPGAKHGAPPGHKPATHHSSSEITSFSFGVESPVDTLKGLASGKRQHQPVIIHKEVDSTTASYLAALHSKKPLELQLDVVKKGSSKSSFVAILSGVQIVSLHRTHIKSHEYEEIKFTFQKIEITFNDGGITASDDWEATG